MALDMLFFLITAAAHWHGQKQHAQQAEAARRAAEHLRAAYRTVADPPLALLQGQGQRLAPSLQRHQAAVLPRALPEMADRVLTEPGWPALAATLNDAQTVGYNPEALLTEAVARRELDSAENVSDVLVWRLRRMAGLPAEPTVAPERGTRGDRGTTSPKPVTHAGIGPANSATRQR